MSPLSLSSLSLGSFPPSDIIVISINYLFSNSFFDFLSFLQYFLYYKNLLPLIFPPTSFYPLHLSLLVSSFYFYITNLFIQFLILFIPFFQFLILFLYNQLYLFIQFLILFINFIQFLILFINFIQYPFLSYFSFFTSQIPLLLPLLFPNPYFIFPFYPIPYFIFPFYPNTYFIFTFYPNMFFTL